MTVYSFVHRSNINRKIDGDRTALMHAAANGQVHLVKFLIEESVDTTLADRDKNTASEIAASNGHLGIAGLIDVYENDDWKRIAHAEELLMDLRSDGGNAQLDRLISLPKFAAISSSMIELPDSFGDFSWFRITERVTMGFHNTNGMIYLTWLIDGHRIDDVS